MDNNKSVKGDTIATKLLIPAPTETYPPVAD